MDSNIRVATVPLCLLLLFFAGVASNTITMFNITNNCNYPIWIGLASDNPSQKPPITGVEIEPKAHDLLQSPAPKWQGIIWARTHCTGDGTNTTSFQCATGDCGSGVIACGGSWLTSPATMLEFSMGGGQGPDYYDISLVGGFNVPVSVGPQDRGSLCTTASCSTDINTICPVNGQVKDSGGVVIACKSACEVFHNDPKYCCFDCGDNDYTSVFTRACPMAFTFPNSPASNFSCSAPTYAVTFCPSA